MSNEEILKFLKWKLPNLYKVVITENDTFFYWTKECNDPCSIREYKMGTTTHQCFILANELPLGEYSLA